MEKYNYPITYDKKRVSFYDSNGEYIYSFNIENFIQQENITKDDMKNKYLTDLNNYKNLHNLGAISYTLYNDPDEAINYLEKAIENGSEKSLATLGFMYMTKNDFKKAITIFLDAIDKHVATNITLGNLGVSYMKENDYINAVKYLAESFEQNNYIICDPLIYSLLNYFPENEEKHYELFLKVIICTINKENMDTSENPELVNYYSQNPQITLEDIIEQSHKSYINYLYLLLLYIGQMYKHYEFNKKLITFIISKKYITKQACDIILFISQDLNKKLNNSTI